MKPSDSNNGMSILKSLLQRLFFLFMLQRCNVLKMAHFNVIHTHQLQNWGGVIIWKLYGLHNGVSSWPSHSMLRPESTDTSHAKRHPVPGRTCLWSLWQYPNLWGISPQSELISTSFQTGDGFLGHHPQGIWLTWLHLGLLCNDVKPVDDHTAWLVS
jgi:hypothetical protein